MLNIDIYIEHIYRYLYSIFSNDNKGKEAEKEYVCVYMHTQLTESLCYTHETNTLQANYML